MYCKRCGKWIEGEATLCEECAGRESAPQPVPGVPETVGAVPAAPVQSAPQPKAAAPAEQKPVPAKQAAPRPAPAKSSVPPASPYYYSAYGRPVDERPLNGIGIGGFVLSVVDMIPVWSIGMQFAHTLDLLYSCLFLFLPMAIFQCLAIVLSAIGLRAGKEARGTAFAKVGLIVSIIGLLMFVQMFIAGLIING